MKMIFLVVTLIFLSSVPLTGSASAENKESGALVEAIPLCAAIANAPAYDDKEITVGGSIIV